MHQWVFLYSVLAALLLVASGAAESSDEAGQLYAAVSSRQLRVQLGPRSTAVLQNGHLDIKAPLTVVGTAAKPAFIRCSNNGPHAFVVRGTTLELQHVVISGCSKQAIVLKGPGAVLKAAAVTFRDNGPADNATTRIEPLGLIISAEEAVVEMTNVTITANTGVRVARGANMPLWRPFLHPPCQDDTVSGGVKGWGAGTNSSSGDEDSMSVRTSAQQPCGFPLLASALIDLEQSTLVLRSCRLQDNTADALITARGDASHSLQLLAGTRFESNSARWLVVADSWTHDPIGRKNMKAPQPSEAVKELDIEPPYTSYALMGGIRSPTLWDAEPDGDQQLEKGRRLLQEQQESAQQQVQAQAQAKTQQASAASSALTPKAQQQQQQQQQQQPSRLTQERQQQQREKQKQQAPLREAAKQQQQLPQQPGQQQPRQEPEQLAVAPDSVVGKAPKGQVPLQVRLQGVKMNHNVIQSGLLWLRLVNTSMQDTDMMYNIGTGGRNAVVRQMQAVIAALPRKAAAVALAEAGRRALDDDTDSEVFAPKVAAAGSIEPPGPCDVGSLQRSLLIVHGPSAFDMLRSRVSHNIHFSGAVMRVTEGLGPTSLRDSSFVNNTATAVLRFEGRTWVLKTDTFFAGIQFLDVLFYTQFQGASEAAYKFAELQHAQQQASKDKVSYDAFWFMSNTSMINNTVFHSLVMSKGSRTSWRSFLALKANILQSGEKDAARKAKDLPLINLATTWWMRDCTLEGNKLVLPRGSTTQSTSSNTGPFSSKAGSPVRSGDQRRIPGGSQGAPPPLPPAGNSNSSGVLGQIASANGALVPLPNEWLQAVPYASYSDVLSAVLDADDKLLGNLSMGGEVCHRSLRGAVDEQQEQLTLQVMLRATAPAVLWASTTQGYIESSTIAANTGFFHTLRLDNAYMTWRDVNLVNNSAAFSVFDLWFGDAWIDGAQIVSNQVQSGSILNFESFRGNFQQILLEANKAGTARPSDLPVGAMSEDADCQKKPSQKRPTVRSGRNAGAASAPGSASSAETPTTSTGATLSPIWRMSHFLGELHKATIRNNTGSIALDISGMALAAPLTELLVERNMASGIRLLLPEPKYDNQSIELAHVVVVGNSLSPAAPLVGGLVLGGFTSSVGATMPVAISNCVFLNNTPAQPQDTVTLQGGGVCIQGPAQDSSDDVWSQHGFLQKLSIFMTRTQVEGNMAAEGGGLWTAWPMIIEDCIFANNHALVSGGGIYSKGLQQDSLGSLGALIINHTRIVNNTASFGGGIACDSCRAILAAQIDSNQAIRNVSLDNVTTSSGDLGGWGWGADGPGAVSVRGSRGCRNGTGRGSALSTSPLRRAAHAVLGAGGGIAANLAGNSYVVMCVSGNGTTIDDRGKSTLRNNSAQALGGAVYLNSTMIAPDCPFPQPGPALTETCFPGGYWPKNCGFNILDLDWQGSVAAAGGDLVAWAGDTSGFNQACTLTGSVCDVNNVTLQSTGVSKVYNSTSSSVTEQGGKARGGRNTTRGSAQKSCVRTFDAEARFVCSAGSGLGGRHVMLVDETRKFQLPASFYVFNTTCIQESSNFSRSWQSCAVAGDLPHVIPRVFSGDTMNLTVSLGTSQQRLHPTSRNQDPVIGIVQLQQTPDGSLFVIGDTRQKMQMGLAAFNNMALQPVTPPISNREYEFRFVPAWGAGNDLLRQVKPVSVLVKLLRCTLGMHMTINRCVRCSANGTYSLNPFTNETIGCQPCPNGGLCQNGLLIPRSGYYSYNPFVPQILPCPLKGGCMGGRRIAGGLSMSALQQLQQQALQISAQQEVSTRPKTLPRPDAWDWGANQRRLLQEAPDPVLAQEGEELGAAAVTEGAEGAEGSYVQGGRMQQRRSAPSLHELHDGSDGADQQQQPQPELVVSRRQALMGYNRLVAQLWANDSTDGIPLLAGFEYPSLLDAWHRLQCNPGYTGMFCGRCDLNYVEGALLVDTDAAKAANLSAPHGDRYGLHMGTCVKCRSPAVIALALFGLFLLLFAYNAFGMCMQLRNSGIRDPYLRFVKALAAQQAAQQQQQQQGSSLPTQGSGLTGLQPSGSYNTLARDSSSSQASQAQMIQGQQSNLPQYGSSHNTAGSSGGGMHPQTSLGHCYSVHSVFSTQVSYGFAVPFAAVGGPGAHMPTIPMQPSVLPVVRSGHVQQQQRQGSTPSPIPQNPHPGPQLVRANTLPSSFMAQRQGSTGQGSSGGKLSPVQSMGSPFLQQAHLPPLPPTHSQQHHQQHRQHSHPGGYQQLPQPQQSVPFSPSHAQHGGRRVSWGDSTPSTSSGEAAPAPAGGQGAVLPGTISAQQSTATQTQAAAQDATAASAAGSSAGAAGTTTAAGGTDRTASVTPPGPPVAAGSSFVFAGAGDQQQPRDQQRHPSPQERWWGSAPNGASAQRQQSLPPPLPHQQQQQQQHSIVPQLLPTQQQQQQQHISFAPTPPPSLQHPQQSLQHSVLNYSPQQSVPIAGSMRHRYQSGALTSSASSQAQSQAGRFSSGAGARPSWQGSPGPTNHSSHNSRRPSNSSSGSNGGRHQQQQQQQLGVRKGPVGLLVGLWKVLTSYLQVLGTIRHISLRALPEMSAQALAWADLSSFTSFVALDCLLPGPQEWHAFIKLFARTIALPILLLLASALMWTVCWLFRHFAARMQRKYGYRHTVRWQPLRQMQRQVTSVPDPFKAYLSPRMLITVVVLSYSLYPLVTSGLLYTLQCVYIPGPFAVESAFIEYSRQHYNWLLQRAAAANSSSSNSGVTAAAAGSDMAARDIQLCSPGSGPLQSGLCWVTGRFWAMDYDVQCFEGHHKAVALFGLVMLLLVGVLFPVVAAVLLWINRNRLDDGDFAWKWSFLYAEYKQNTCFWEFIIMGRKLAFLAATILLPMALDTPEETTAQMQLLVCVLLAVTFLLLHASLHPFKRGLLNRMERLGLTAIAMSCTLLAASLVVEKGRLALLALLGVVNVAVVATFLYHIGKQFWLWVGAPASKAVSTAYKKSCGWWERRVSGKLQPKLRRLLTWPPSWRRSNSNSNASSSTNSRLSSESGAGAEGGSGGEGGEGTVKGSMGSTMRRFVQRVRKVRFWGGRGSKREEVDGTQKQQQQQVNGHVVKDVDERPSPQQQREAERKPQQQKRGGQPASAADQQQQQQVQLANGTAGHAGQQQQQAQANGHAPQLQANESALAAVQQQQQQQQPAPPPQHNIHQISIGRR